MGLFKRFQEWWRRRTRRVVKEGKEGALHKHTWEFSYGRVEISFALHAYTCSACGKTEERRIPL